jgi:hypothetical protein
MRDYTDHEIAEMAVWAERNERATQQENKKKAFGAIRQGLDWLLRERILEKQEKIEEVGKPQIKAVERHQ